MHGNEVALFHTGSLAEFHEPHLRLMMANYIRAIGKPDVAGFLLTNDAAFVTATQTYKNAVTCYHQSKTEVWFALVMQPVY